MGMNKKKLTDDERQEIINDYNSGMLVKDLVKKYARKPQTIRKTLHDVGITIKYNKTREIPAEIREKVVALYAEGESYASIAQILKIGRGSVGNILRENDVKPRPKTDPNVWNDYEIQKLQEYAKDRSLTYYELSNLIGGNRTTGAVEAKCRTLGVSTRDHYGLFGKRSNFRNVEYRSESELKVAKFLFEKNISFEYEKPLTEDRGWTCDFYLPDYDIWLEVDGLGASRRQTDSHVDKYAFYNTNHMNYIVIRPNHSKYKWYEQITKAIRPIAWNRKDVVVRRCTRNQVSHILKNQHYTRSPGSSTCVYYGIYHCDKLIGAVNFGACTGARDRYAAHVSDIKNIRELSRMVVLPRYDRNIESYCLSRALKLFKKDYPQMELMITFSRPEKLHFGYIYQATNWFYFGRSNYGKEYVNAEGVEYPWTAFKDKPDGMTRKEYAASLGFVRRKTPKKFVYGYFFDRSKQPENMEPYPKMNTRAAISV